MIFHVQDESLERAEIKLKYDLSGIHKLLKEVDACLSTDAMVDIIVDAGYKQVFKVLADKAARRAKQYMRLGQEDHVDIEVYLFSMDGSLLARSEI